MVQSSIVSADDEKVSCDEAGAFKKECKVAPSCDSDKGGEDPPKR